MLTTDGAAPSYYAAHGMIGGALSLAVAGGVDPMRALQMATIDPATFLNLDEELGGLAPGRRATLLVLPGIGEWRPELVLVDGRVVAQDGRLTARVPDVPFAELPGYPLAPPRAFADPSIYVPAEPGPVMRYESAVINRRAEPAAVLQPGQVHAALVARDGSWVTHGIVEGLIEVDGFATTATTSLELLVLGRDPAAMARAAARVAELGGGFAFDRGWSAPLEIDGLIAAGRFDKAVTLENHLSHEMIARGYRFHDPLYSLLFASGDFLPEVRLTPRGTVEVKSGAVLAPARPLVGSRR
jgi:adenine deaminase